MGHFIGNNTTAVLQFRALIHKNQWSYTAVLGRSGPRVREAWSIQKSSLILSSRCPAAPVLGIYERETEALHTSACPSVCLEVFLVIVHWERPSFHHWQMDLCVNGSSCGLWVLSNAVPQQREFQSSVREGLGELSPFMGVCWTWIFVYSWTYSFVKHASQIRNSGASCRM